MLCMYTQKCVDMSPCQINTNIVRNAHSMSMVIFIVCMIHPDVNLVQLQSWVYFLLINFTYLVIGVCKVSAH